MTNDQLAREASDRLKAIQNERAKLMATYFNGLAIAVIVVGAFSPAFSGKQPGSPVSDSFALQAIQLIFCLVASFTLHVLGRLALGAIR